MIPWIKEHAMNSHRGRDRAFTIVEILVVISILAILMALLLPALSGAKRSSQKLKELNAIRQVGLAWNLYSTANNDAALPGYLEPDAQYKWNVTFEYPDDTQIPQDLAAPWPWRLLPYLDNTLAMIHGYRDLISTDLVWNAAGQDWLTSEVIDPLTQQPRLVAEVIASEPAFGYNAYYVGGWWGFVDINGNTSFRPKFYDARADINGNGNVERDEYARVVAKSVAQIRRATQLVVFCSSAIRTDKPYKGNIYEDPPPDLAGTHWVVPPLLALDPQWRVPAAIQTEMVIEVYTQNPVPTVRYTGADAVLDADTHTDAVLPGRLADQRSFIDIADKINFAHQ